MCHGWGALGGALIPLCSVLHSWEGLSCFSAGQDFFTTLGAIHFYTKSLRYHSPSGSHTPQNLPWPASKQWMRKRGCSGWLQHLSPAEISDTVTPATRHFVCASKPPSFTMLKLRILSASCVSHTVEQPEAVLPSRLKLDIWAISSTWWLRGLTGKIKRAKQLVSSRNPCWRENGISREMFLEPLQLLRMWQVQNWWQRHTVWIRNERRPFTRV